MMTTPKDLEVALLDFIQNANNLKIATIVCIVNFALGLSLHTTMIIHVNGKF